MSKVSESPKCDHLNQLIATQNAYIETLEKQVKHETERADALHAKVQELQDDRILSLAAALETSRENNRKLRHQLRGDESEDREERREAKVEAQKPKEDKPAKAAPTPKAEPKGDPKPRGPRTCKKCNEQYNGFGCLSTDCAKERAAKKEAAKKAAAAAAEKPADMDDF